MLVLWDEPKRIAKLDKHGLDFARFADEFAFETAIRIPAQSSRTGRPRFRLIGELDDELAVVAIVSPLGTEALALISLRRASASERDRYGF